MQEIVVEVFEEGPDDHIRREMVRCGWTLRTKRYMEAEDSERDFSDLRDEDYLRSNDDNWEDDYDINNDSDSWRRAAD